MVGRILRGTEQRYSSCLTASVATVAWQRGMIGWTSRFELPITDQIKVQYVLGRRGKKGGGGRSSY